MLGRVLMRLKQLGPAVLGLVLLLVATTTTQASGTGNNIMDGINLSVLRTEKPTPYAYYGNQPHPYTEYTMSEAYAKAFILAHTANGAQIVANMKHRVFASIPSDSPGLTYTIQDTTNPSWGGYVEDTSYTSNNAWGSQSDFYVQSICNGCADVAAWVGVGGWINNGYASFIQTGDGFTLNQGWYECAPNAPQYKFTSKAGDLIFSFVDWDPNTSEWYITVSDQSSGAYWSGEVNCSADKESAEQIVEVQHGPMLSNLSAVPFSSAWWYDQYNSS